MVALPGFRQESVHQGRTFTVVKYRALAPVPETRVLIARLALQRGTPDFLYQPGPSQP